MASLIFLERVLHYSDLITIKRCFQGENHKTFIPNLQEAINDFIQAKDWNRGLVSGAACLFWMFGISDSKEVRTTVQQFLKHSKYEGHDSEDVVKKINVAVAATVKTFEDRGFQGKVHDIDQNTNITGRELAKEAPLLKDVNGNAQVSLKCATISLLHNHEKVILDLDMKDRDIGLGFYVQLLANLRQEKVDQNHEIGQQKMQEYLENFIIFTGNKDEERFNMENEADQEFIDTENIPTTEDLNKGKTTRLRARLTNSDGRRPLGELTDREANEGRTREQTSRRVTTDKETRKTVTNNGTERSPSRTIAEDETGKPSLGTVEDVLNDLERFREKNNPKNVIGHSYKAGRGARVFIGSIEKIPTSLRRSTWVQIDPDICVEETWKSWIGRYHNFETSMVKTWEKTTDADYQAFLKMEVRSLFQLQKGIRGLDMLAFFAEVKSGRNWEGQVITVKGMTEVELSELRKITQVNEAGDKPPRLLTTEAAKRALESKREKYSKALS